MLGPGACADATGSGVTAMELGRSRPHHPRQEPAADRGAAALHRLHSLRRPQDLGGGAIAPRPQRRRALGPVPVLRGHAEVRLQGAGHSGRRQQGRVPAGAVRDGHAGAGGLGRHSARRRLGHRRHQRRHSLHLRHLVARRLRRHHGRLGVELEVSVPLGAALRCADGQLRSLHRLRHHHGAAVSPVR